MGLSANPKKRTRFRNQRYRDYKVRYLSNNDRNTQDSLGALASFRRVLSTPTRSAISCRDFMHSEGSMVSTRLYRVYSSYQQVSWRNSLHVRQRSRNEELSALVHWCSYRSSSPRALPPQVTELQIFEPQCSACRSCLVAWTVTGMSVLG